jgi:hypothetical protein
MKLYITFNWLVPFFASVLLSQAQGMYHSGWGGKL